MRLVVQVVLSRACWLCFWVLITGFVLVACLVLSYTYIWCDLRLGAGCKHLKRVQKPPGTR